MAIEFKDYYAALGVAKGASAEEIKQAYRKLARQHHPDLHAEKNKAQAGERFKEINEAYEVLSDPQKRKKYDELGPDWESAERRPPPPRREAPRSRSGGEESFEGFSDFFESLFGEGARFETRQSFGTRPGKGQDVEAEMELSLEDAFHGGEKRISIAERPITVHLPRHVRDGSKLRLRGQGAPGGRGGEPGDLYLRIRLSPHSLYKVSGSDLETTVTVMPWEAALGGEVSVPSLEGPIRIKLPAGTHAGRRLRIPGKGLYEESGSRGALYAVIRIDIPERADAKLERLFKEMKKAAE